MTVTHITPRLRRVTPKQTFTVSAQDKPSRPTIATPVLTGDPAEKCIRGIDEDLDCLYCVAGTLAAIDKVPEEVLEALMHLRHRMKRNIDILYSLG